MKTGDLCRISKLQVRSGIYFVFILLWLLNFLPALVQAAPGDLDPAFGTNGIVRTSIEYPNPYPLPLRGAVPHALVIQSDGKMVAAGQTLTLSDYFPFGWSDSTAFVLVRYNTDGRPDTSFGFGGIQTTVVGDNAGARALQIQSDGKLVAAGWSANGFTLIRYNSSGIPDNTFGSGGIVTTKVGDYGGAAHALQIQPDGKLIAAGVSYNNISGYLTLIRYNSDGTLDTTFGVGGIFTTSLLLTQSTNVSLVIQSDGKLLLTGNSDDGGTLLVRCNTDGSLDGSFHDLGYVVIPFSSWRVPLAMQSDGKLLLAGTYDSNSSSDPLYFALFRYNSDGSLDATFGESGMILTSMRRTDLGNNSQSVPLVLAVQSDGKIVAAGGWDDSGGKFTLVRYNPNGTLDTSFGSDGMVITALNGFNGILALAIQSDTKLVAAGFSSDLNFHYAFTLARYINDSTVIISKNLRTISMTSSAMSTTMTTTTTTMSSTTTVIMTTTIPGQTTTPRPTTTTTSTTTTTIATTTVRSTTTTTTTIPGQTTTTRPTTTTTSTTTTTIATTTTIRSTTTTTIPGQTTTTRPTTTTTSTTTTTIATTTTTIATTTTVRSTTTTSTTIPGPTTTTSTTTTRPTTTTTRPTTTTTTTSTTTTTAPAVAYCPTNSLKWRQVTTNTDGDAIKIRGYHIYVGSSTGSYRAQPIDVGLTATPSAPSVLLSAVFAAFPNNCGGDACYVIVKAYATGEGGASDEVRIPYSKVCGGPTPGSLPDLGIRAINGVPKKVKSGKIKTVTVKVKNYSNSEQTRNVRLFVNGQSAGIEASIVLAPRKQQKVKFEVLFNTPGEATVEAILIPGDVNPANDVKTDTVTIQENVKNE